MKGRKVVTYAVMIVLTFTIFLSHPTDIQADRPVEIWPTEGWATSTPEEQGMDSTALAEIYDYVRDSGSSIRSMLVVRHGFLVAEEYFTPVL